MHRPRLAKEIIYDILAEVAPERFDLLREIVELEDTHISDKGTTTEPLVAAAIERAAKGEAGSRA